MVLGSLELIVSMSQDFYTLIEAAAKCAAEKTHSKTSFIWKHKHKCTGSLYKYKVPPKEGFTNLPEPGTT